MELLIRILSRKGLPFFAVEIFRFLLLAHSCIKIMYQRQPLLCFSFGKSMLVFYLLPISFYMAMSWCSGVYDNNKHFEQRGRKDIAYERALKVYYDLQNYFLYFFPCFLHMIYIMATDLVHLMVSRIRF